ncbi:uncharacterized protein LOC129909581 [Episyrphus balteatus]|uniref:uncharacterized protein LOC129909581 n=1 Tax=Episyrphus balteatus TaxID=286459 RepID=UPI0024855878|nr:uncharacterized protein LOC129909581 [Episyrphus balteatus]
MFSPSHRFKFFLLVLLPIHTTSTSFQIKDIIERTSKEKDVSTIAFFGRIYELELVLLDAADTNIPRMVFTESYGELYFAGDFNKHILVVACINLWHKSMLNRIDIAFHGIHAASRSVFLVPGERYKNLQYLWRHFEWCWASGFVNVVVVFLVTNETFSYTRFPQMKIFRGTLEDELFPDRFNDLMGYPIRSPLQYDPPRVYTYIDLWGHHVITGYCAELFLAFLDRYNATMEEVRINNSTDYNMPGIVHLINRGKIDISIHTYMGIGGVRSSYPVRMMQWCILVPSQGEIKAYWYFIRPFQFHLWLSCLAALIGISCCVVLEERLRGSHYDFGRSCCNIFRFMLCLPTCDSRPFAFRRGFRQILIFMLGFMLTNLYLAYLTSFLAKIILKPQIETLAELVQKNISILTLDFEIPILLKNMGLPKGFDRLLTPISAAEVSRPEHLINNKSLAYTVTDDKALFVLMQQIHLKQPLYTIVDECVSTIPIGFLLAKQSPFEIILNRFILSVSQAGLIYKWFNDMYSTGLKARILKVLPSTGKQALPLTMEHFQFAWIALIGGLFLATICFVLENLMEMISRFRLRVVVVHHSNN